MLICCPNIVSGKVSLKSSIHCFFLERERERERAQAGERGRERERERERES